MAFLNDERLHEFLITIKKTGHQEGNQEGNQESNQESNQETAPKKIVLTKVQKDIVNFCSIPRTAKEILDRIGISNQSINRKRHILTLVELGVIEMTIPERPNDRNQKYKKKR